MRVLDRIDPEVVETSKGFDGREETDETFHERNKRRKVEDSVGRKMVGLKFIKVKEAPEEI